jgi:glucose/mannose-6-phosphate isomerase
VPELILYQAAENYKVQLVITILYIDSEIYLQGLRMANGLSAMEEELYNIYQKWPRYFEDATNVNCKLDHEPDFYKSIILCGMGGSATACDIINDVMLAYGKISTIVVRGHHMPSHVDKHTLVLVNSASGNTEEVNMAMEQAVQKKAEVICISSGGKLKDLAAKYGLKHIAIKKLRFPRAALPYLLMPGIKIVSPFVKKSIDNELASISKNLSSISKNMSINVPLESSPAKKMAAFVSTGMTFCLTSPFLLSVGIRFKNSLNENSKMHCINESVLEASHNEVVPLTSVSNSLNPKILFLRWGGDDFLVQQRFTKMGALLTKKNQPLIDFKSIHRSLINAIISTIYILDYSTLYVAMSRDISPALTPAIDILKDSNSN